MRSLFILVVLIGGILFIARRCGDVVPGIPPFPSDSNNTAPADRPTAGHAITPNPFHISSREWLWDSSGLYLLDSGSNIALELFDAGNHIVNLQGVVYSKHNVVRDTANQTVSYDYFVWLWTSVAVYRYRVGEDKLIRVGDETRQDIQDVKGIVTFPGVDNVNDEVWLWTAENFYQMSASNFDGSVKFEQYRDPLAHIQAIKPTYNPRYVFIWTVTELYLYDMSDERLIPVKNPAGAPITSVQGVWMDPITTVEPGSYFFTVMVWNELDLYRIEFMSDKYDVFKVLNNEDGAINGVQGVIKTLDGGSAALWAWTPRDLYLLSYRSYTETLSITLERENVTLETITGVTSCPDKESPLYVWNETYLIAVTVYYPDYVVQPLSRPDGTTPHNSIQEVIPCPTTQAGIIDLPEEVWWWDSDGFYRRQTAQLPATPVLTPDYTYLAQTRGLMIGLYEEGQQFWIWNNAHVYQFLPDGGGTKEILGPDGLPLANVWMTQMRPERNELETGYTLLIRNSQNVYQYMVGNERAVTVTVGNERRAITSPPYTLVNSSVVLVGQSAHFAESETTALFWPRLNTVLRPNGDAAASIESGSGHCNNVTQDC